MMIDILQKGLPKSSHNSFFLTQKLFKQSPRIFATKDCAYNNLSFRIEQLNFRDFQINQSFSDHVPCNCGLQRDDNNKFHQTRIHKVTQLGNNAGFSPAWGFTRHRRALRSPVEKTDIVPGFAELTSA